MDSELAIMVTPYSSSTAGETVLYAAHQNDG